ncbi:MAG: hypothetical protein ABIU20_08090 [Blastocatellia bacterium]
MPIPALLPSGILTEGIYECNLEEVEIDLSYNPIREEIWNNFQTIKQRLMAVPEVNVIYIDGSFLSDKDKPSDVDIAVEFFNIETYMGVRDRHGDLFWKTEQIKDKYKVDIRPGYLHCPKEEFNAIEWFQSVSRKEARTRRLPIHARKGILKVVLRDAG